MMKTTITYFLLALLLLQHSGRLVVWVWFEVNQSEIAQTLCENRARPQLHCDGQCVLAKKLQAVEEREQRHMANVLQFLKIELVALANGFSLPQPAIAYLASIAPLFSYGVHSPTPSTGDFFHPPRF